MSRQEDLNHELNHAQEDEYGMVAESAIDAVGELEREVAELKGLIESSRTDHRACADSAIRRCDEAMAKLADRDDELAAIKAELDRANGEIEGWREGVQAAKEEASSAIEGAGGLWDCVCMGEPVEPHSDDCPAHLRQCVANIVEANGQLHKELAVLKAAQRPRPMSEVPRVWSGPETHIIADVWKFGWTPTGYRWMGAHHRLSTGMIFVPMQYQMPERGPSEMTELSTCNKVDWLPDEGAS